MKLVMMAMACMAALALSACGREDSASHMVEGPKHSLSLLRDKPYFWSSGWDLVLVTTNLPDCMRRNKLDHAADTDFKVELYRTFDGAYILRHENNWYVTEMQKCALQQFKTPPPVPGDLLGSFEEKDERLQFVNAPPAATTSPGAAAMPPAAQ